VKIRDAHPRDVEVLASLMGQLGYPTTPEAMARRFREISGDLSYATLVAETGSRVVGMVGVRFGNPYYERDGSYARIAALGVDERHRGRGIGRTLVGAAEKRARCGGDVAVVLNSGKQRKEAHRFYRALGYEDKGLGFYKTLGN
jgi:GNAT superfamily N-acetyltransferase